MKLGCFWFNMEFPSRKNEPPMEHSSILDPRQIAMGGSNAIFQIRELRFRSYKSKWVRLWTQVEGFSLALVQARIQGIYLKTFTSFLLVWWPYVIFSHSKHSLAGSTQHVEGIKQSFFSVFPWRACYTFESGYSNKEIEEKECVLFLSKI